MPLSRGASFYLSRPLNNSARLKRSLATTRERALSGRCQHVLASNAPAAVYEQHDTGLRGLLRELGIASVADLEAGVAEVEALLPRVSEVAEAVMAVNPEIEG